MVQRDQILLYLLALVVKDMLHPEIMFGREAAWRRLWFISKEGREGSLPTQTHIAIQLAAIAVPLEDIELFWYDNCSNSDANYSCLNV